MLPLRYALHLLHVLLGCLFGSIIIFSNYFFVLCFFGQSSGSCCTNFLIISIREFDPKKKIYYGGLCTCFCLAITLKTIIDTAMKLPHCIPQCIPLQVEPRLLPAQNTLAFSFHSFLNKPCSNSSVFWSLFSGGSRPSDKRRGGGLVIQTLAGGGGGGRPPGPLP